MVEKKYEEVGNAHRFFLGWRHAAFLGNAAVLYAVAALTISAYKDARPLAWLIPVAASPIGILLYFTDVRTRDLYHAAICAGKALEGTAGGFYTELWKVVVPKGDSAFSRVTQSAVLNVFFIGSSVLLLLAGLVGLACC